MCIRDRATRMHINLELNQKKQVYQGKRSQEENNKSISEAISSPKLKVCAEPVSYTHLDVYKRQQLRERGSLPAAFFIKGIFYGKR